MATNTSASSIIHSDINASKSNNIVIPLVFGIIGTLAMISFLIILCLVCRSWHDGLNWMNNVQHMIQLDGELWHKQIDSLQNTIPPKEVRVLCRDLNYDYLKRNPSVHIVFAVEGIIIDAIFVIRYDLYVVHQVHLIHNTENTGYILRLVLVTRINSLNTDIDKGLQIAFEIYLFMASHIQLQQITDIRESILSNSHKHLAATGYYKNVRNDLQLNTINR
ncbi:hypothetical protein I4U23_015512 [Adineta vaga]|nr:hypothetical protein I4U23_015512 [Adineta vaga]